MSYPSIVFNDFNVFNLCLTGIAVVSHTLLPKVLYKGQHEGQSCRLLTNVREKKNTHTLPEAAVPYFYLALQCLYRSDASECFLVLFN